MALVKLHRTTGVKVGSGSTDGSGSRTVQVGGGAPVVVQSMTMTDTADAAATAQQCIELAEAGSNLEQIFLSVTGRNHPNS